jgi:hypothetical protein
LNEVDNEQARQTKVTIEEINRQNREREIQRAALKDVTLRGIHNHIYAQGANEANQTLGKEQRYEQVSFGASYNEMPVCCKLAYLEGRIQQNLDRSAQLEQDILATRASFETQVLDKQIADNADAFTKDEEDSMWLAHYRNLEQDDENTEQEIG